MMNFLSKRIKTLKLPTLSRKDKLYYLSVIVLLLFFLLKTIELAISIRIGIAPDEPQHIQIINLFSNSRFFLEETPEMYAYGQLTHSPYLYYLLLGQILKLNFLSVNSIIVMRLFSVLFSFLTVLYTWKLALLVSKSRLAQLLTIVLITNIAMFTFLSSAVSYDNLVNLLATVSIYHLVKYYKDPKLLNLLLYIVLTCLGLLTKITFVPLAVITGILLIIILFKQFKKDNRQLFKKFRDEFSGFNIVVGLLVLVLGILVFNIYGSNLGKYGKLIPNCYQVTSYENCQQNPTIRREEEFESTTNLSNLMDPYNYIFVWKNRMYETIFGIFGHESLIKRPQLLIPFELIIILALVGFIRTFSLKNKPVLILTVISAFYILVLAYFQNYGTYRNTGIIHLALQGRYLFSVLAPILVLVPYFIFSLFKNQYLRIFVFLIVSGVFILGDHVYFKRKVPDSWYSETAVAGKIRETNRYFRYNLR